MILSLIAAMLTLGAQTNPSGVGVMPSQAAFYSAAGGTALVEIRNALGLTVPCVDSAGHKYSSVQVTLPAATAVGLGYLLTQTKPDGTDYLLPLTASQYSVVITMACNATESPVGTYDSSVGAGNGIAVGYPAPSSTTPTQFVSGSTYLVAIGAVISGSGSLSVQDPTLPVNLNPYAVCLADIGGAGATVGVEYIDANGTVIPPVDSNGVKWSAITVTLPASGSRGLSFLVLATSPDGSHAISVLPTGAVACRLRVITGTANVPTVAVNTGGTTDGSAGTGTNGYATGFNPNSSSPTALFVFDTFVVGRVRN